MARAVCDALLRAVSRLIPACVGAGPKRIYTSVNATRICGCAASALTVLKDAGLSVIGVTGIPLRAKRMSEFHRQACSEADYPGPAGHGPAPLHLLVP